MSESWQNKGLRDPFLQLKYKRENTTHTVECSTVVQKLKYGHEQEIEEHKSWQNKGLRDTFLQIKYKKENTTTQMGESTFPLSLSNSRPQIRGGKLCPEIARTQNYQQLKNKVQPSPSGTGGHEG